MLISISDYRAKRLRQLHISRLENLSSSYTRREVRFTHKDQLEDDVESHNGLGTFSFLKKGIFSLSQRVLLFLSLCFSVSFIFKMQSKIFIPLPILLGLFFRYLNKRKAKLKQTEFINEYPAVLLATASNLKAGLSVYSALERAIQLLDDNSAIKGEIKSLLEKVARGVPKEQAVSEFANGISLPELRLFKRAFILVLVHGGKFSRTLERLSEVCRDRDALIKSANVSTASMRMTANILLAIAPLLMLILSLRTKNFWTILFENSTASAIGLTGAIVIGAAFLILRNLSDFKP